MSLVLIEGFEIYGTSGTVNDLLLKKHSVLSGTWTVASGRIAGYSISCNTVGSTYERIETSYLGDLSSVVIGWGYNPANGVHNTAGRVLQLFQGGSNQIDLRQTSGGTFQLTRNGTVLSTGTAVLTAGTWYYLELKAVIANAGSAVFRINGSNDINFSGDTQNTTSSFINRIGFGGGFRGVTMIDDIYVANTSGTLNNDFLGDSQIAAIYPNAAGNSTGCSQTGGTANFDAVNENGADGDTSYVYTSSASVKDTYDMLTLSSSRFIHGLQINNYLRKTGTDSKSLTHVVRSQSTDYESGTISAPLDYDYVTRVYDSNPNNNLSWILSDLNSSEFGFKTLT